MANKKRTEKVELTLLYHHSTEKGVQVSTGIEDAEGKLNKQWLPISQIEVDTEIDEMKRGQAYTFRIPQWLVEEKGLDDAADV